VSAALAPPHEALENFLRNEAPLCRELSGSDGNLSAYFTFLVASAFGNSESDIDSAKTALSFARSSLSFSAVSWERFG
jgi:hypothetical protein